MPFSMVKDLHDGSDMWTIVVRVFRKWNIYQKAAPSELFCISLLFIDAEGTKIQASIINKSMHQKFCNDIKEGKTYEVSNFIVSPNTYKYRPTTHPFKLTLTAYTSISEVEAPIPTYSYSFINIFDILSLHEKDQIEYLFDVIAFVSSIGTLEEDQKDNETKYRMRMVLQDVQGNDIECVLWDNCASDAYLAQLQNNDTPVVALLNLARLGTIDNNRRQLCSSFYATRVSFNPPIQEVQDLIESAKNRSTPITTTFSQRMPSQMSHVSGQGSLHNQNKITISQIQEQTIGSIFVINCQVQKFETKNGWVYDGCAKCSSKPKLTDENDPNSALFYPNCKRAPESTEPKMKLHYIVKDDSGSYSVLFWDQLAVQLLNMTVLQLKLSLPEKDRKTGFPKELENPVGKKLLIKLKMNQFTKKFPGSSLSVSEFLVCEDLLHDFDEASVEGNQDPTELPSVEKNAVVIPDDPEATDKREQASDEQDMIIIDLSNNLTQPTVKGKRKATAKRSVNKVESSTVIQASSKPCTDERILKAIKQEK